MTNTTASKVTFQVEKNAFGPGFTCKVIVGGTIYAWVDGTTKANARREGKAAAEEMGLVNL